ncbi:MAG TPA: hypothetical protein VNC50_18930, partial [Planctomycetia bacterium]|nr:hypothetical protein [Planctomycetia bacterium]
SAGQLFAHLGYLNAFIGYSWIIPVFWTLAIEFQFYLLVAVFFPLLANPSASLRFTVLGALCGLGFLVTGPEYVFPHMGLFSCGIVTFHRYVGLIGTRAHCLLLAASAVATVASLGWPTALAGVVAALAIAYVRPPRIAPLAFLGLISYSLYLLHIPIGGRVINLGARYADGLVGQIAVLAVAVVASIVSAWLLYRLVERPAQRWSSRMRYERTSTSESASEGRGCGRP